MRLIENTTDPQIGDFFIVRTVEFKRNNMLLKWPVFAKSHSDKDYQPEEHYHIDWRFMTESIMLEHRKYYQNLYPNYWKDLNAEYFEPIMKDTEVISESYEKWKYLRNFDFPKEQFIKIEKKMIDCGAKMKNMRCPHHGTNLTSCKPVNGVVTCPQHGLRWNIKTGELI